MKKDIEDFYEKAISKYKLNVSNTFKAPLDAEDVVRLLYVF